MLFTLEPFLQAAQMYKLHRASAAARTDECIIGLLFRETDSAYVVLRGLQRLLPVEH